MPGSRWKLGIVGVAIAGLVLRITHLGVPMRYDEAHTVLQYTERGLFYAATHYGEPNNHILHTLLVNLLVTAFGDAAVIVRLPALIAGALIPVAGAWLAWRLHSREAALLTSLLLATAPVLIEYSTNARGYSLLGLFVLLGAVFADRAAESNRVRDWILLAAAGVLGAYTMPVMLFPWAGLCLWLALRGRNTARAVLPRLALLNAVVGVCVLLLYSPIVFNGQLRSLIGNAYVAPLPFGAFLVSLGSALTDLLQQWSKGVPLPLLIISLTGIGAAIFMQRDARRAITVVLLGGAMVVLIGTRNYGFARVWLWLLPFVMMSASAGIVLLLERLLPEGRHRAATIAVGVAWSAAMVASLLVSRPVWESRETGAFPEAAVVADTILAAMARPDNPADRRPAQMALHVDPASLAPLHYYLRRASRNHDSPTGGGQYHWIVLDHAEPERTARFTASLAERGVALAESQLVLRTGNAEVRLIRRTLWATS